MVVPYDEWFTAPVKQARAMAVAIGHAKGRIDMGNYAELKTIVNNLVDTNLRHHYHRKDIFTHAITCEFYEWLRKGEFGDSDDMIAAV